MEEEYREQKASQKGLLVKRILDTGGLNIMIRGTVVQDAVIPDTDLHHTHNNRRKTILACIICCVLCFSLPGQMILCRAAASQIPPASQEEALKDSEKSAASQVPPASQENETQEESETDEAKGQGVTFLELNDEAVFLKQSRARVCTLTASAMMIRRAAMLSGNTDWKQITEKSVRKNAWSEGTGLKWNFKTSGISVTQKPLASSRELVTLLASHPEGVVIYNPRKPHAILITDYTDGIFYCSDPAGDKPSGRYPVSRASITVESATRCWYVSQPQGLTVIREDSGDLSDHQIDGIMYRILDSEEKTAECTGFLTDSTSVIIPDTVLINGAEYKVAEIAENAFAYDTQLKEIVIGANVTDIGQRAFYQCKKLKKVWISAQRLKEIGTEAFAQIHKKAQILIEGAQIETFAALLTGTAVPQTVTVGTGAGQVFENNQEGR